MRNKKYPLVVLLIALACFNCRKTDQAAPAERNPRPDITDQFFNAAPGTSPVALLVMQEIQRRNTLSTFVNEFSYDCGLPVWNKAIALTVPRAASLLNTNVTDTVVYVPLVQQGQSVVNGYIRAEISDSISLSHALAADYASLPFNDTAFLSANKFAARMMYLNREVFGHDYFKITDKRLFPDAGFSDTAHETRLLRIDTAEIHSLFALICFTQTIISIRADLHCTNSGQCTSGSCDGCSMCVSYYTVNITTPNCQYEQIGGGTGTVGGTWNPGPTGGGGSNNPPGWVNWEDEVIDPCAKVAPLKTDDVYKAAVNDLKTKVTENKEYAYLQASDGLMLNIFPGIPNDCEVRVTIYPSSPVLKLFLHDHNNACKLPIFSPEDLKMLHDLYTLGKTDSLFSFGLVTDSSVYLMVIDDVSAFANFINNYFYEDSPRDINRLSRNYESYKINRANSAEENEKRFLQFLKREGAGIKLLKANADLSGYSQIQLNANNERISTPCN